MPPSNTPAPVWLRDPASRVMTAGIVLALLYVGRDVLIPLVLALMLSLLLAPLVRAARRIGIGRIPEIHDTADATPGPAGDVERCWLWGPVGPILSTPLTLCLVVAGRHAKALGTLELLLSDSQALTLAQKFYQRALSGDPHEIIADAHEFLKRDPLAAYCDRVLIPALHLGRLDADAGATSEDQHLNIRRVTIDVVAALCNSFKVPKWRHRGSVLEDVSAGRWLRQQREQVSGRWQGPLGVPPGSVVICLGLDSSADDLAAELLARLLLAQKIDARHFSPRDLRGGLPPGADPEGVSIFYLVSAFPNPEREHADSISTQVHALFPYARVVRVFCPGVTALCERAESAGGIDQMASSLVQVIDICMACQEARNKQSLPPGSRPAGVLRAGS